MHKLTSFLAGTLFCLLVGFAPVATAAGSSIVIDINAANAEQLAESLPGIGPAKAARIVQWRKDNGAFITVEQLQEIKGIGAKTVEKLRKYVRIGSAADAQTQWLEEDAKEQMVRLEIRRIVSAAALAATSQSTRQVSQQPWYKRSALQIMRTH